MKKFNITGTCVPHLHYMVNIESKVQKVIGMIERGEYFVISRPRQYGKTSMIYALEKKLQDKYVIISTSFEGLGDESFGNEESFSRSFLFALSEVLKNEKEVKLLRFIEEYKSVQNLKELNQFLSDFVKQSERRILLIIDEVDKASNFNLFISFLGMLRDKYLKRNSGKDVTFHSVILAGLHDIKNIKLKMRPDSDSQYNSPWNIATEFDIDMSFNPEEIETMLVDYAKETSAVETQNIVSLSQEIHKYTSGYPFLVSRICKLIDEKLNRDWSLDGIQDAINLLLKERNTLFDDLIKNIENNRNLHDLINGILIKSSVIHFNLANPVIDIASMYGIISFNEQSKVKISNKIFETYLYEYLISKLETGQLSLERYSFRDMYLDPSGNINMEHVLLKFQEFIKNTYSEKDIEFYERHGRLLLIAFIKPIINGSGFYYLEPQHSYERRSDMIITFNKKEYILELKLWYGEKYHQDGLKQLAGYLESRNHNTGYLVAFNFNKNKEFTSQWNEVDGKKIFEVIV